MGGLGAYGMKAASTRSWRRPSQHDLQRIVGDLLNAEINEKQARSIKYSTHRRQAATRQRPR
jgi:hypothetical protein